MGMIMLKCPACGASIELEESREYGFCTYCGTKVMTDKVIVEHKGKVQIDNSENVERFLQNARRALEKEDWEEAEKYYNLVEQYVPYSMEAVFFSAYGKAMQVMYDSNYPNPIVDNDYHKKENIFRVLNNSLSVISDYYEITNENKEEVLKKISNYIDKMYRIPFIHQSLNDRLNSHRLFKSTRLDFLAEIKEIALKHKELYLQELIKFNYERIESCDYERIESRDNEIQLTGCYIATSVYGSYDCPEVWTLRRYRDWKLKQTLYGRIFVKCYYAISPTVVRQLGDRKWFNRFWKKRLNKWVKKLQSMGYESTRYYDQI